MQPPPGPAGIRQYCFSCGCPGSDTATMRLECLSSLIFISMDGYDDMCLFVWKCLRPPPPPTGLHHRLPFGRPACVSYR